MCCNRHFTELKAVLTADGECWAVRLIEPPGVWLSPAARIAVFANGEWLLPPYQNTNMAETNAADARLLRGESKIEILRHGLIPDKTDEHLHLLTSRVLTPCVCGRPFISVWFCVEPVSAPVSQPPSPSPRYPQVN